MPEPKHPVFINDFIVKSFIVSFLNKLANKLPYALFSITCIFGHKYNKEYF